MNIARSTFLSLRTALPARRAFHWDIVSVVMAVAAAAGLTALLDTGYVAHWVASQRATRLDEGIAVVFLLLIVGAVVSLRRWVSTSRELIDLEETPAEAVATKSPSSIRTEVSVIGVTLLVSLIVMSQLDTGEIASWVARQSHTRIDEAIVSAFILLTGMSVFSTRRWMDLSRQLGLSEELRRSTAELNREIARFGELMELLQACQSTDEASALLAEQAAQFLPQTRGAIFGLEGAETVLHRASWGPDPAYASFAPSDCWALRRGREHIYTPDSQVLRCAHVAGSPARALCMPMIAHGDTVGLLYIEPLDARDTWPSPVDIRLAKTLADQGAVSISNLALQESLRLQSLRDPLTGTFNRRHLDALLVRAVNRAVQTGSPLTVLMIDLDHFKQVNDTCGHDAGDRLLRAAADVMRAHVRDGDTCCRYGGEEFVVLLPDSRTDVGTTRADAILAAISRLRVPGVPPVTVSIGVATAPDHGTDAAALLQAADDALYRAKEAGRARVLVAHASLP